MLGHVGCIWPHCLSLAGGAQRGGGQYSSDARAVAARASMADWSDGARHASSSYGACVTCSAPACPHVCSYRTSTFRAVWCAWCVSSCSPSYATASWQQWTCCTSCRCAAGEDGVGCKLHALLTVAQSLGALKQCGLLPPCLLFFLGQCHTRLCPVTPFLLRSLSCPVAPSPSHPAHLPTLGPHSPPHNISLSSFTPSPFTPCAGLLHQLLPHPGGCQAVPPAQAD